MLDLSADNVILIANQDKCSSKEVFNEIMKNKKLNIKTPTLAVLANYIITTNRMKMASTDGVFGVTQ